MPPVLLFGVACHKPLHCLCPSSPLLHPVICLTRYQLLLHMGFEMSMFRRISAGPINTSATCVVAVPMVTLFYKRMFVQSRSGTLLLCTMQVPLCKRQVGSNRPGE